MKNAHQDATRNVVQFSPRTRDEEREREEERRTDDPPDQSRDEWVCEPSDGEALARYGS